MILKPHLQKNPANHVGFFISITQNLIPLKKSIENRFFIITLILMRIIIFSFYFLLKFSMKLDGKSIQVAIAQLVEDYKFDAFQIFEIVKMGIRS
jgi:hypothetical protein